jgi:Domain of unknown function (DUF4372)/Transposase DDE domain
MNKGTFFTGQPIFTQLLSYIPKNAIKRLAKQYHTDHYCKKFDSYHHLIVMLFAGFQKCDSLRSLITGLMAWQDRLQHLGIVSSPRRSTLADANERRDCKFFEAVYYELLKVFKKKFSPDSRTRSFDNRLHMMDSTTIEIFSDVMLGVGAIKLNGKRKGGVKAHMLIDGIHHIPQICFFSEAKENDRIFMDKISLLTGSILVFDKGFTKHSQWQRWTEQGITWVTRMNKNAFYERVEKLPVKQAQSKQGVISDEVIWLGRGTNSSTEIIPARRIVFYDKTKKRHFVFITNNERLKPATIAGFYKRRWDIETNFKAIKQNFQLRYFLGDTANAIQIQLWCTLIVNLLIRLVMNIAARKKWSFANLCALIRMHLGTYVNLIAFLLAPEKALLSNIKVQPLQLKFNFNSS